MSRKYVPSYCFTIICWLLLKIEFVIIMAIVVIIIEIKCHKCVHGFRNVTYGVEYKKDNYI